MVYAVGGGRVKPPKHIMLPFAVKSLTGNVELIQILNRLGHSISYSMMEEIDTALCLQKVSLAGGDIALSVNIHPGMFTTLAWDNIDRLEETISGGGTLHRVNGIAIQKKPSEPMPAKVLPSVSKTKKRSIAATVPVLPPYNFGKRAGPPQSKSILDIQSTQVAKSASMSDIEQQSISGWTGFNILPRDDVIVTQDSVGYLPTVNAPATQMFTVYEVEVLNQSLAIMQPLHLENIVCVFDQALYAKAVEIIWKHPDKFQTKIIIRLGVFHMTCMFLSTIGKRFQGAGLRDLCVESGVIAEGSIAGVMDGRKYNRAIRLHKLVYEALLHLAWKGFMQWLEVHHTPDDIHMKETLKIINEMCKDVSQESLLMVIKNNSCARIIELFEEYLLFLREGNGSLSSFWMSYVDMVGNLLEHYEKETGCCIWHQFVL